MAKRAATAAVVQSGIVRIGENKNVVFALLMFAQMPKERRFSIATLSSLRCESYASRDKTHSLVDVECARIASDELSRFHFQTELYSRSQEEFARRSPKSDRFPIRKVQPSIIIAATHSPLDKVRNVCNRHQRKITICSGTRNNLCFSDTFTRCTLHTFALFSSMHCLEFEKHETASYAAWVDVIQSAQRRN